MAEQNETTLEDVMTRLHIIDATLANISKERFSGLEGLKARIAALQDAVRNAQAPQIEIIPDQQQLDKLEEIIQRLETIEKNQSPHKSLFHRAMTGTANTVRPIATAGSLIAALGLGAVFHEEIGEFADQVGLTSPSEATLPSAE